VGDHVRRSGEECFLPTLLPLTHSAPTTAPTPAHTHSHAALTHHISSPHCNTSTLSQPLSRCPSRLSFLQPCAHTPKLSTPRRELSRSPFISRAQRAHTTDVPTCTTPPLHVCERHTTLTPIKSDTSKPVQALTEPHRHPPCRALHACLALRLHRQHT
jgi:hypothetical protein